MSGPTLVMGDVSSSSGLSSSHSTPGLISLSSYPYQGTPGKKASQADDVELHFDMPAFDDGFTLDTSFSMRDGSTSSAEVASLRLSEPGAEPQPRLSQQQALRRSRTGSLMARPRSWFPSSKSTARDTYGQQLPRPTTSVGEDGTGDRRLASFTARGSAPQDNVTNLARRSWLSSSTPASPQLGSTPCKSGTPDGSKPSALQKPLPRSRMDFVPNAEPMPSRQPEPARSSKPFTRASSYFSKIVTKQPNALKKLNNNNGTDSDSCASSALSLAPPASNTTEAHTSRSASCESSTIATDDSCADMPPQGRDPLWSSFKNLEVEHKGFTSKSTPQRIVQVQTILLPFLHSTMDHSSTRKLPPEDVDRRATILNKWWLGILEMMDGIGMASVPGVDRPILFDALTAIMMRPEWRQTTSHFLPLNERSPRERVTSRALTHASETTNGSDHAVFVAESAEHSVRTMFVTALAKQLGFVVQKMGVRHAPLALVSFAGKTCAYAFFFLPGAADIMVRLWGMGPELIRRAGDGLGLPRVDKGDSEDIVALFPPRLACLGWTTPKNMWNSLKKIPKMPVLISQIPWMGHTWVSRWKGKDTDLLFVFYKFFHILADDFMPSGLPLIEKARAPGFALVHAQLLSIIDDTIHRQSAAGGSAMMDPIPGADASALVMPLPPPNLMKDMSENSLVMLLRDMLSNGARRLDGAKHTFAEACVAMIKSAVRKTSQFDNAACFTLCDFLEEVLTIFDNFEDLVTPKEYIDWPFWLDVFKKILGSLNTMSEVRVLSFIFSIWEMVAGDPTRKAAICLDWLLTEEVFDKFFNHWCPMVRAYYHRLLCWRICRCEGDADEVDTNIFVLVSSRLKKSWGHYLYLKQVAEDAGRCPPSSAPMVPTPGKKFMIIRQEVNQPQPGLFVNFDSFAKMPGSKVISGEDFFGQPEAAKPEPKKRWSLLGKVLSLGSGTGAAKGHGRRLSWDEEFANARRETAELRSREHYPPDISVPGSASESDSACSSPLYEEQKYVFKFFLAWHQPATPPRERILNRPRLPGPAQGIVSLHNHSSMGSATPNQWALDSQTVATMKATTLSANGAQECMSESAELASKPTGIFAKNSIYSGRALAEWGQVIWECNNFVDRRRDEGVLGLHEVEVPMLGVETFRKPCG